MKKLIFSFTLILGFSSLVKAQWVTIGTNVTYSGGNVGIGPATPQSLLHISGTGTNINQTTPFDPKALIIQANNGGRGLGTGAQLEFAIPANTDGTNLWGQARIITVAANGNNADATGKMILGTRRLINKLGTGATWYYGDDITIAGGGNVGIGTVTPGSALSVVNSTPTIQLFDKDSNPGDGSSEGKIAFGSFGSTEFASIEVSRVGASFDDVTAMKFKTSNAVGAGGDGNNIERMRISPGGNVGIGVTNPQNKLDVNGTIHSKSVLIDLNGWGDYVFKKGYYLRPLNEVKDYIDKNQHLPEIPSAQEIEKEGLNLGEMNKLLMKKVEELTLYLIEKDREEKEQKQINRKNANQMADLKKQVKSLTLQLTGKK